MTAVTRDHLESGIWRAMAVHHMPSGEEAEKFVTAVIAMADAYASGDDPRLTALRCSVLRRDGDASKPKSKLGGKR